ncbi:hypothetical protein [Candidatus Blastococcus massiliensis]|uniref:hypothetical protein n=1 Tax=Candidatus Blastococcus massiliensis TaxID=1470358 RepID=UPI0004B4C57C|nr:hypothetical protein [Candidatus Blastococcus massiliensis]
MNELEHTVRSALRAIADDAGTPAGQATARRAVERHRRDRRRRAGFLATAAAVTAVVAGVVAAGTLSGPAPEAPIAAAVEATEEGAPAPGAPSPSSAPAPEPPVSATGGSAAECVEAYSPAAVAGRAFAFDGTVTAIGPARQDPTGSLTPISAVTFRVHDWYRGGSGETVTVDLNTITGRRMIPSIPDYQVGTRLLVSGEPRWGGAPLDAPIAWGCGFTQPYDARTAAAWAAVTE